jgi:hypothetical protein
MGPMADLSPAAQAIMIAATNGNHNCQADPVYRQCIAAALRAVADQVVPHTEARTDGAANRRRIRRKLLAIADELES